MCYDARIAIGLTVRYWYFKWKLSTALVIREVTESPVIELTHPTPRMALSVRSYVRHKIRRIIDTCITLWIHASCIHASWIQATWIQV